MLASRNYADDATHADALKNEARKIAKDLGMNGLLTQIDSGFDAR